MRHANRLWDSIDRDDATLSKGDLVTITADVHASRVFDAPPDAATS